MTTRNTFAILAPLSQSVAKADNHGHLVGVRRIPDGMSYFCSSKGAVRDISLGTSRRGLGYPIESAQPSFLLRPLLQGPRSAKIGRRYALQHVLQCPNITQDTCDTPTQIARQPPQKLKSTLDSRRTECGNVIRPEVSKNFRLQKLIFCPVLLQRYSQRRYRGKDRGEFGRYVGEDNNCFTCSVISLRLRYRHTFDSDLLCTAFSQSIGLLSELPYSDAGHDSGQDSPESDNQGSGGKEHCEKRDCNRPSIPPNNTVTYARLHAWAHTAPQIANPTHSVIPLWIQRHSATAPLRRELAHG